ncbi:MAG: hypothetical protein RIA63_02575, partial [Cyclobacteriaceae bacterium]
KQHFVKRFQIETNTNDKDFGFISESIGSRLEFVTTSDSPEVQVDMIKGKGKTKETETINLEDIVDVKGWKALGNRLSPHKISKLRPVEEPEGELTEELAEEATKPKGVKSVKPQSQKKKSEDQEQKDEPDQSEPSPKKPQAKKPKLREGQSQNKKAAQASLFEESQPQKESKKEKVAPNGKKGNGRVKKETKAFGVGDTIELEL